jgi:tetratricopeptide (TPR) repeat protein
MAQRGLDIARSLGPEGKEILCFCLGIRIAGRYEPDRHWDYLKALLDEREQVIQSLGSESLIDPRIYQAENEFLRGLLETLLVHYEGAQAHLQESLRLYKKLSHGWRLIEPYHRLGVIHTLTGDYSQARRYFAEALSWAVESDHIDQGDILSFLWAVETLLENPGPALAFCQQYIRLAYRKNSLFNIPACLEMAAKTFARRGRYDLAARLSGAAEALSENMRRKTFALSPSAEGVAPSVRSPLLFIPDFRWRSPDCSLDALVPGWPNRSDRAEIQQAWDEGRAMTYEQAIAYGLSLSVE